ncbi:MAG: ribose-phosphate pyrophosphokinase [Erysipelotrichaceae bacterium]|nr:ribose-phosphate pyrophosphokinase [Erysipelotrichaceae bacterium]
MLKETIVFSLTSSIQMTDEIVKYLDIPKGKVKVMHFADGEICVELEESVRGRSVYIVQSTCNPVTERLMEVLVCIDACKRSSAREINVVMPYFGYARQDRKAAPRQPITAKLVANLLQVAGANRLITIDLHASQIQGFFDIPIDDMTAIPMLGQYFVEKKFNPDDVVVVSPDHGGTTRARKLADILNCGLAIVDKRRPKPNVCEAINIIGEVEGKTCIIVDDMCDTGGSLVAATNILKQFGAGDVYVMITHGVFSRNAIERLESSNIKEVVVSNTIELSPEQLAGMKKIKQISVAYMIARTIEAIETHAAVSAVYEEFQ